jgi:hypothetical protein
MVSKGGRGYVQNPCPPLKPFFDPMKCLITAAGSMLCMIVAAQSADDNRTKEALSRNHVKTQTNWDYVYTNDKPAKTGIKTSVTSFDASGQATRISNFNPKGLVVNIEKYQYDPHGNRTEYTRYTGDTENQVAYQKLSKYNGQNLVTEESGFDGVENFNHVYSYDPKGELSEIRYNKNKTINEKRTFSKSGNATTVTIYNGTGALVSKLLLKYDANKNLVEETAYGVNQAELEKKTYNYDDKKNLKEEAKYKQDKVTLKTTYSYSPSGNLLEINEESATIPRFLKKGFTYDTKGNLTEIRWRRKPNEEFNKITYTYDQKGLCITSETWYPVTKYRVLTKYEYITY